MFCFQNEIDGYKYHKNNVNNAQMDVSEEIENKTDLPTLNFSEHKSQNTHTVCWT